MKHYAGIDAGSTYVKVVMMDENKSLLGYRITPTGTDAPRASTESLEALCRDLNISIPDVFSVISTGYSRRMIDIAHENVTEIKAHGAGAQWTAPQEAKVRTVIDIGGQDCKVIIINEEGEVENFVMNDKCAAGTGRFLEAVARIIGVGIERLGPLSLEANVPCRINSTCVVFAESEMISLLARKEDPVDIIAGIHASMSKRISGMARKAGLKSDVLVTGGGGLN
ncbi:MAG: acyl-CoA dehydratase activase, partial [Thermodesulfobacteriota bacterium]|nr:acyl-CoA dehydratase activase [Thermodesulfobacteriota bacterium]